MQSDGELLDLDLPQRPPARPARPGWPVVVAVVILMGIAVAAGLLVQRQPSRYLAGEPTEAWFQADVIDVVATGDDQLLVTVSDGSTHHIQLRDGADGQIRWSVEDETALRLASDLPGTRWVALTEDRGSFDTTTRPVGVRLLDRASGAVDEVLALASSRTTDSTVLDSSLLSSVDGTLILIEPAAEGDSYAVSRLRSPRRDDAAWTATVPSALVPDVYGRRPPVERDGWLLFPAGYESIGTPPLYTLALDLDTGEMVEWVEPDLPFSVVDDTAVTWGADGSLRGLDLATGRELWTRSDPISWLLADGGVLAEVIDGQLTTVRLLSPRTGEVVFDLAVDAFPTAMLRYGDMLVLADGSASFGLDTVTQRKSPLLAYDLRTGAAMWSAFDDADASLDGVVALSAGAGQIVATSTQDRWGGMALHGIDPSTGALTWTWGPEEALVQQTGARWTVLSGEGISVLG
ncbi:outer membrane protein assembly factor BamB family protein [Tessaracoccus palaemonis]|uniref:PQQ-like beta-propeller repeat protein n=1 Tax=Tessaracoccus palaemonis TaxID=2829499 RepID=A0ABX8SI62_9ACTN|nr:PQQ-binding-like beta-propeller repeat protein [Tessaracoccus palaemonis]QXT63026.1 PQQ-like beta-propeller repeat protein [Tessaracoccus palaemonis]